MRSDIRKILTIVLENQTNAFSDLLGDGSQLGVRIQYKVQIIQRGIDDYSLMVEGKDKYIDELTSRIDDNNSVIDKINREIR